MPAETNQTNDRPNTASKEDVAKFTALADTWWDERGAFKPLHQINPLRVAFIREHLIQIFALDDKNTAPLQGLNVLDIGCGGGILCEPMCRLGATVTGIDAGEKNIQIAQHHAAEQGLHISYKNMLPENMNTLDQQFDVILNMEVIEHVTEPALFMKASSELLRPGGIMFIATLNRTLKSLALAKIGAEYILRWLPIGTHDWRQFVKPSELAHWMRPYGLTIKHMAGMQYQILQDCWQLSPNLDVNYLLCAEKSENP